ncbi:MAG: DMT family transporter [Anaerolineae bacterium]|jgi:drug/metabolite transporter (DMT)-like permease
MSDPTEGQASETERFDWIGFLSVLLAAACWGTSGIFVKYIAAGTEVTALALAFWRDLTTFLVLLTGMVLFRRRRLRVERRDLPWLLALGASLGIFHVFWNLGVLFNGAAVATVQQAAMPAIVAVVAWLIWSEALTWDKILAIVLTFVGTVLVTGIDALQRAQLSLGGLLIGLGIPITYAAWTLFGKQVRQRYDALTALTYAFGFGALVLLPFQFFTPQPWPVPGLSLVWFAALIGLSTIVPFSAYTFGLGGLPASVASIVAMSEIPIVSVYAYFLLDERLSPDQLLGAGLVVAGVLLLSRRRPQAAPAGRKSRYVINRQ